MATEDRNFYGTTLGEPARNGMPERKGYVYRGGQGRPIHGRACPACGGRLRSQGGGGRLGICCNCRELVVLRDVT